jgi:hypothetical protein
MSGLLTGTGPLFLAAEVEIYQPGGTATAAPGEAWGVLATATLTRQPEPLADSTTLRASDLGWVTRATDPAGIQAYAPILTSGVEIDRQMDLAPGGQGAAAGWGALRFANEAGALTALALSRNADGRAVRLRIGRKQQVAVDRVRLVAPTFLHPLLTFSRAHTPTDAVSGVLGADGQSWSTAAADVPRRTSVARWLRLDDARTNRIRNPRAVGAVLGVVGSGGVRPANWTTTGSGLNVQVLGTGSENGIDYVDLRLFGTPTSTFFTIGPESGVGTIPAAVGETWTFSCFIRRLSGVEPTLSRLFLRQYASGGAGLGDITASVAIATSGALASNRTIVTRSLTAATTASILPFYHFAIPTGVAIDISYRLGWPQLERASFASDPILPAIGSTGVTTRGTDTLAIAMASLGLGAEGDCTLLLSASISQAAPTGIDQPLAALSDGTGSNALRLRNAAGGSSILAGVITSSLASDAPSLGTMQPGTSFRLVATIRAGRIAASLEGGPVQAIAGGPTTGLTTLRLGEALFGEIGTFEILPYALPDAALPARCLAIA